MKSWNRDEALSWRSLKEEDQTKRRCLKLLTPGISKEKGVHQRVVGGGLPRRRRGVEVVTRVGESASEGMWRRQ
jgi:hypothetical protein